MASSSKGKAMEKTISLQDHQPLKCPRCDSSNTKFCYYNNYSLSQPRHFCKACKRYWTRGGMLRNVPVGGGCRKNKRVKRPAPPNGTSTAVTSPRVQQQTTDLSSASNHVNNSMFYNSLSANYPAGLSNFPFSRLSSPRVSTDSSGYDFNLAQISGIGLGFNPVKNMDDVIGTSNSSVAGVHDPHHHEFLGSSTSTMASLLASSLQNQKFITPAHSNFPETLMGCDGMQMPAQENCVKERGYKFQGQNRLGNWNLYAVDQQIGTTDSSSSPLLWNNSNVGSWFDPSNMGSSSVPSLI